MPFAIYALEKWSETIQVHFRAQLKVNDIGTGSTARELTALTQIKQLQIGTDKIGREIKMIKTKH